MKVMMMNAWPYQKDKMNLPVPNVDDSARYYVARFGFEEVIREQRPVKKVSLQRDGVMIGIAENGGDPTQDGCFFEVNDIVAVHAELKARGVEKISNEIGVQKQGDKDWKTFFVVAPDGLCFCFGQRIN